MHNQLPVVAEITVQNDRDFEFLKASLQKSIRAKSIELIGPLTIRVETESEWDCADLLNWLNARHAERTLEGDVEIRRQDPDVTVRLDRHVDQILEHHEYVSNLSVQRDLGQFADELLASAK